MSMLSIDYALGRLAGIGEHLRERTRRRDRLRRRAGELVDLLFRGVWHVWRNRHYLTPMKLVNMAAVNLQCRLRTERVAGMPYRMKIEPTNICNTHCQLCPTGVGVPGRAKGKMDFEQFRRLIDRYRRFLYTLDLSMWGDPLIVPDIYRMIRYAHDRGVWTYLSSNLHAVKPDRGQADALVRSGLDMLTCSLHGASQETYEQYQPGKQLDGSIEKIKAIVAAKQRLGSATPAIQLNFVVTRFNEHEIEDFRRLAESLGCKAVFSSPSLNLRYLDEPRPHATALTVEGQSIEDADPVKRHLDHWLPTNDEYVIEPYRLIRDGKLDDQQFNGRKVMDCQWPWKDCVINWDGSVVTCCGVFETDFDMGNVFERPLREIWNSKSYRMARRSFKRPAPDATDHANPCRDCPGFML